MSNKKHFCPVLTSVVMILSAAVSFCGISYKSCAVDEPQKIENITFLGDSTTNSLRFWGVLPGGRDTKAVFTGVDSTLSMWDVSRKDILVTPGMYSDYRNHEEWQKYANKFRQTKENAYAVNIGTLLCLTKPQCLVITLGINGCSSMCERDFKAEYEDLINVIQKSSPDTVIMLNSILPVGKNFERIKTDNILRANSWIADIAAHHSLKYLDTYSHLSDTDGYAPADLIDKGDGLHWNQRGCRHIVETILSCINGEEEKI